LGIVEPTGVSGWKFGVWRLPSQPEVTPFLLVNVLYDEMIHTDRVSHWGWMQTIGDDGLVRNDASPEKWSIVNPETIFLLHAGRRVTITSYSSIRARKRHGTFQEHPHSWGYLIDRSRLLHDWLKDLLARSEVDPNKKNARSEPQALLPRAVNTYAHPLWISATKGTVDRRYGITRAAGQFLMPRQSVQLEADQYLNMLQDFIERPASMIGVKDRQRDISAEKRPSHTLSSV